MELDPVLLSRVQFAFVISFHIIFPAFTIGLAAWLATLEGVRLLTGNQLYRRIFDFWLKIFALSFGMGVVSGIVMAFQFSTNWSVMAVLAGWFTAEVGRQPWVVYGLLRTKDAVTPSLTTGDVLFSLAGYVIAYATIFGFGLFFIHRLLRDGPGRDASDRAKMTPARPLAVAMQSSTDEPR